MGGRKHGKFSGRGSRRFDTSREWFGLAMIGFVKLTTACAGKTTEQVPYFISSLPLGRKTFTRAIRSHERIANSCHCVLDAIPRENESRTREKCVRKNFAWLYRFILSLLKQHLSK
jgi:predicted transposase YbfD/YdcC